MKKKTIISYVWLCVLAVLLIAADQLVKAWALNTLKGNSGIDLIPGVFRFSYVENRGMAFGMMQGGTLILGIGSIIVAAILIILYHKIPGGRRSFFLRFSFILIIAGALGNLYDRLIRGYVVDMLDFCLINFPVFNVADCLVVVGGIIAILVVLFDNQLISTIFDPKKDHKETGEGNG